MPPRIDISASKKQLNRQKAQNAQKNQLITAPGDITQQVRLMNNLPPMYRFESLGFPIDT